MISKEEIKKAKECLQETIQNTYAEGKAIKLNNVLKYIDQLESDKQKLIEKLEEDINELETLNDNYTDTIVYARDEFKEELNDCLGVISFHKFNIIATDICLEVL